MEWLATALLAVIAVAVIGQSGRRFGAGAVLLAAGYLAFLAMALAVGGLLWAAGG